MSFSFGLDLHVFPCRFDKRPAISGGFKSATNDPAVIDLWSRRYFLMAAPTGAINGFDVLDIDKGGEDWLATYEATHGLPATRIHATRSGGLHIFFRHRPGLQCHGDVPAPNIDIRSTGGYVILWHLAGCRVLSDAPIAPWPVPMLQLLHEAIEARGNRCADPGKKLFCVPPVVYRSSKATHEIPKPLYRKVCELMPDSRGIDRRRMIRALRDLLPLREDRNKALLKKAAFIRETLIATAVIDQDSAAELLLMASHFNGYVEKCGGEDFAKRTIKSAFNYQTISGTQKSFRPEEEEL
jgi:hypothetical protein